MSYKEDRKNQAKDTDSILNQPRKKAGRPKKKEITARKKSRKGDIAVMNEYKARLLASPKSRRVLDSILNAALDDDHKHQAAAWKLLVDRLMPLSSFDKDAGGSKPAIEITIKGLGATVEDNYGDTIDGDIIDGD